MSGHPSHACAGTEGRRGYGSSHLQPGTGRGWVVSMTLQSLFHLERPGTHCTGVWVGLGAGLNDTEDLASPEIRSPTV
jgi:hypothetical protein